MTFHLSITRYGLRQSMKDNQERALTKGALHIRIFFVCVGVLTSRLVLFLLLSGRMNARTCEETLGAVKLPLHLRVPLIP